MLLSSAGGLIVQGVVFCGTGFQNLRGRNSCERFLGGLYLSCSPVDPEHPWQG